MNYASKKNTFENNPKKTVIRFPESHSKYIQGLNFNLIRKRNSNFNLSVTHKKIGTVDMLRCKHES